MISSQFSRHFLEQQELLNFLSHKDTNWNRCLFYKLNFETLSIPWASLQCKGAVFVACTFSTETPILQLLEKGAFFFQKLPQTDYDPYHKGLYSPEELMKGSKDNPLSYLDNAIYKSYTYDKDHPTILSFFTHWMHDHSIEIALNHYLGYDTPTPKKVVAIMGGHSRWRTNEEFQKIAEIARSLTREGYTIASGGGPGAMEAANLGAWLSPYPDEALDDALHILSKAPQFTSDGYLEKAWEVKHKYPDGGESLSVPTWFYGHEPTNVFATHIAKYFSNSIREDGLLAIAYYGVIFTPGKAGTVQEIFMDATQNHYGVFKYISPMIFFGKDFFGEKSGITQVLQWLSQGLPYAKLITISDSPEEILKAIKQYKLKTYTSHS